MVRLGRVILFSSRRGGLGAKLLRGMVTDVQLQLWEERTSWELMPVISSLRDSAIQQSDASLKTKVTVSLTPETASF